MTADRPRDVKVDLDIISRGLLQVILVLLRQPFQLSPTSPAHLVDHHFPSSTPPAVRNALIRAFTELAPFGSLHSPLKNVSTRVPGMVAPTCGPISEPSGFPSPSSGERTCSLSGGAVGEDLVVADARDRRFDSGAEQK
jgi:hypothetical protein